MCSSLRVLVKVNDGLVIYRILRCENNMHHVIRTLANRTLLNERKLRGLQLVKIIKMSNQTKD